MAKNSKIKNINRIDMIVDEKESFISRHASIKNKELLSRIDKKEIDIRDVMKHVVESGRIEGDTCKRMDTTEAWRWITTNKVDYEYEERAVDKRNWFDKMKSEK